MVLHLQQENCHPPTRNWEFTDMWMQFLPNETCHIQEEDFPVSTGKISPVHRFLGSHLSGEDVENFFPSSDTFPSPGDSSAVAAPYALWGDHCLGKARGAGHLHTGICACFLSQEDFCCLEMNTCVQPQKTALRTLLSKKLIIWHIERRL